MRDPQAEVATEVTPGIAKALLVRVGTPAPPTGGRALLSDVIERVLGEIYGAQLVTLRLRNAGKKRASAGLDVVWGHIDGVSFTSIKGVMQAIDSRAVSHVYLDGSNLGAVARAVKRDASHVSVMTFFHNCEARFFVGALRQRPSMRAVGVLLANYVAERSAVRFSDKRICLNKRDSQLLSRLYGTGATHLVPMAMQDLLPTNALPTSTKPTERYALFVGGNFYANRQGIEWYVDHVAKLAPFATYVVGQGFEGWKDKLERNGNVKLIGAVESVVPWYLGAQVVIAPIFDGSGMKTKVAEALMFGKRVVGTPEAFVGYEEFAGDIGVVCATAAEFLAALEDEACGALACVDPMLRGIYEANYSYDAAKTRLAAILGS